MLVSINKNRYPNFMPVCMLKSFQSWLMLWDSMDCNPPCSSVHGILQARRLEWVAMSTSRRSFQPRNHTLISYVSYIGRQILCHQHHLGSPQILQRLHSSNRILNENVFSLIHFSQHLKNTNLIFLRTLMGICQKTAGEITWSSENYVKK